MIRNLFATVLAAFAMNAFAAVDANQASRADLETVKGIGPGLSGKIVEARKGGEFRNWSDFVDRIGGIGPGNATRLSNAGLTVAGAAFDPNSLPAESAKAPKSAKASKTDAPAKTPAAAKPVR